MPQPKTLRKEVQQVQRYVEHRVTKADIIYYSIQPPTPWLLLKMEHRLHVRWLKLVLLGTMRPVSVQQAG